jgi:uncharacterized protein
MPDFINREKEIQFLKNWLGGEPNSLLFVYGPKSSGKTTLMTQLIENHLDLKKMAVNYLNLRGVLIYNFKSFLDTFFVKTAKDKLRDILAGVSVNIPYFKFGLDDEALLKQNPFRIIEGQLTKARKKGLQPVLIIDEIQNLKNIYMNGERFLLDELFNLFVRLTKEIHVAHVILITSDSYFIEEIYINAKLKKTTRFFHVGHLPKFDVQAWLSKEGFEEQAIQQIWEKLGGSAWEITELIKEVKNGKSIEAACEYFINDEYSKLQELLRTMTEEEENSIRKVNAAIAQHGYASTFDFDKPINPLIPKMVEKDVWFFRTDQQKITANSESIRWAMKRLLEHI